MRAIIVQRKKSSFWAKSAENRYCFYKEIVADRNVRATNRGANKSTPQLVEDPEFSRGCRIVCYGDQAHIH